MRGPLHRFFGEPRPLSREEDFIQANRLAALAAVFNAAFVLLYVGVAAAAPEVVFIEIAYGIILVESALMLFIVVFSVRCGFEHPSLPTVILGVFLLFDSIIYVVAGYIVLFSFMLTVVISARYHDVWIARRTILIGFICLALSAAAGFFLDDIVPTINSMHNYLGLGYDDAELFSLTLLPTAGAYLCASAISYGITVSGIGLLKGSEELVRGRSQVEAAANIQQQLLPRDFGTREDDPFSIQADIAPIHEVSGDYYDGARVRDICFFEVADVSDKGLPAAMFAMRAQSLVYESVASADFLGTFTKANRALCENNDSCMFVTMILGMLDLKTGHVVYVNAGHEPIALRRGDGSVELIEPEEPDPALGLFDDASFHVHDLMLGKGDMLLAFTDGVTDAANEQGQRFETDGLVRFLKEFQPSDSQSVVESLISAVSDFCGSANQNDDMTALALTCTDDPSGVSSHAVVDCDIARLGALTREVLAQVERVCCPAEVRSSLGTIIDEVGSNIIEHAFDDVSGRVFELDYRIAPHNVTLRFADEGIPFDPLHQEESYTDSSDADIDDLQIGGWGIHLVCNLADSVSYERKDARNVLTVEVLW